MDAAATLRDAPPSWRNRLDGGELLPVTIGCSGAAVFRLRRGEDPPLLIKVEPEGPFAELPDETQRLAWAHGRGLPCPRVLEFDAYDGAHWLLMTCLPGRDLASSPELDPATIVALVAGALKQLHVQPIADCPFDQRLDARLAMAAGRVKAGVVDEDDFDEERLGRSARELLDEAIALRPQAEALVVTHGDACLPNFIAQAGRLTGFVDLGRLGVADRHQDLALARRSIVSNLGEPWGEAFLSAYGGPVDRNRLDFYQLIDEFF